MTKRPRRSPRPSRRSVQRTPPPVAADPQPPKIDRVLAFIASFIEDKHHSPNLIEIAHGCELSSKSHAKYYVDRLRAAGRIQYEDGLPRTISLINPVECHD